MSNVAPNRRNKKIPKSKELPNDDGDFLTTEPLNAEELALRNLDMLHTLPLPAQKVIATIMVGSGTPIDVVAAYLKLSNKEFGARFKIDVASAKQMINGRIGASLAATALYEKDARARTTAAIFWMKCQAGWREDGTRRNADPSEPPMALNVLNEDELAKIESIVAKANARQRKEAGRTGALLEG